MSVKSIFIDTFRHHIPRMASEIRHRFAASDPAIEVSVGEDAALKALSSYASDNPIESLQRGRDPTKGIEYLRKMKENDAHYAAMLDSLIMGLLSHDRRIVPGSEDDRDIEIGQFTERCMDGITGTFGQFVEAMCDAVSIGFSINEITYRKQEFGEDAGRWMWREFKDKDQMQFKFQTDGFGNLEENGVIQVSGYGEDKHLPADKFVIFTYNKRRGSIYGNGLGVVCSWFSWFKRDGMKSWLVLLQKWANPTAIGRLSANAKNSDKLQFQDVMNSICDRSGIVLPEGLDISLLEASRQGEAGYMKLLGYCNDEISKRILGATLTSETGETGSYAQAKVHADIREEKIRALAEVVSDVINEQAIPRLIDYNFLDVENYPRLEFVFGKPLDRKTTAEGIKFAQEAGIQVPKGWAHEELRIPVAAGDEENLMPAPKAASQPFFRDEFVESPIVLKLRRKLFPREEQFSDIPGVSTQLDRLYETALEQARKASIVIKDDILKQVKKKLVVGGRLKRSLHENPIVVNVSLLRKAMINQAMSAWLWGQLHVVRELERMGFDFRQSRMDKFAEGPDIPLPSEAVKFFKNKVPITKKEFLSKLETERDRYFTVAGLAKNDMERTVQPLLLKSIEKGDTFEDFRYAMEKEMVKYTGDVYSGTPMARVAGQPVAEYHLATVFRTNLMGAYNHGRMRIYDDPDVGDFIPWLQYSAVMDDVTTDFCEAHDGRVYPKDDPIWDSITPPNHFKCRSTVIGVPYFERGIKISAHLAIQPAKGF